MDYTITLLTADELSYLLANTPKALPANPTQEGYSAERIKEKSYQGQVLNFKWIQRLAQETKAALADMSFDETLIHVLSELPEDYSDYESDCYFMIPTAHGFTLYFYDASEEEATAINYETAYADEDGNRIKTTYATNALAVHLAGSETITGKKTFTGGVDFDAGNVSFGHSGSDNSKTLDVYYSINLRGPIVSNTIIPGNTFALGSAEHYWGSAYIDNLYLYGEITDGMYEWVMPLKNGTVALTSDVSALESDLTTGVTTVLKATKDADGNTITSTYETKSDATAKVARANLVSILGEATTSLSGLLSSTDKSRLDALYALLGASADSDTVVNTINEVLAIFDQYPEGVTLTAALALKSNISDIVDALTSSETAKPLSAKQGKALNDRLAAVEADYLTSNDAFAAAMFTVTDYDQSTGEITLEYSSSAITDITYTSSTGEIVFTY